MHGSIYREYREQRGPLADLGYPTSDTRTDQRLRSRYVDFEGGRIYSFIPSSVAVTVKGGFWLEHLSLGGVGGVLGYPVSNQVRLSPSVLEQRFDNGIVYAANGGWHAVYGSIDRRHRSTGGVSGPLGPPLGDLVPVGDGLGSRQVFAGGQILHRPTTGAFSVTGPLLEQYLAQGGPAGPVRHGDADGSASR